MTGILRLVVVVATLIGLLRWRRNLTLAVSGATLAAVLLFHIPVKSALTAAWEIIFHSGSLQLFAIVVLVIFLGSVQKETGMFDRLIRSLNSVIRDGRIVAMVGPAIIGFLPMPGGALFSAPLVEVSTRSMNLTPHFRTYLNYWFRHPWEFVWPIYAGLLLFQTMSGYSLRRIILYQAPFTLIHILGGLAISFIYYRRHGVGPMRPSDTNNFWGTVGDFLEGTWPIMGVIILFFGFGLPLHVALLISVLSVVMVKRLPPKKIMYHLWNGRMGRTLLLLAVVLVFQKIMLISHVFAAFEGSILSTPSAVLLIIGVSFTMGLLTGVNTAFIAIAFPILHPLIQGLPNAFSLGVYVYVIGFCGVLLSPLHLCLVLTNEYFKSSLLKVYRYLLPSVFLIALVATILTLASA